MRRLPPGAALAALLAASLVTTAAAEGTAGPPLAPLLLRRAAVAAGHPEAAEIGVAVLRSGGNAMDATVAVSLALGVAEPYGSSLGGRLVVLYHDASARRTVAVHGLEATSFALDVAAFRALPVAARSEGATSVCVPGLPAALHAAHRRFGRRPWPELVRPAIALAREGFEVLPRSVAFFAAQEEKLRRNPEARRLYLPNDALPVPGTRLANPDLARTLERLAAEGPDGFYRGPVAQAIVAAVVAGGGTLTLDDLARYEARASEPLAFSFAGYEVLSSPPPFTGGATVALALTALDGAAWPAPALREPASLDLFGRVLREAYPAVQAAVGDVPDVWSRARLLLSPDSVAALAARVRAARGPFPGAAASPAPAATPEEDDAGSTTHFVVVDSDGNIASVTQSTGYHFGSGLVAPGTGVSLNNWMNSLAYADPRSVNFVAPGKRGRSTTTPSLVLRGGRPVLALGVPGGQRIPSAIAQLLIDVLRFGRNLGEAIGDVRVHLVRPARASEPGNVFELEPTAAPELVAGLERFGWQARVVSDPEHFGGVNAVELHADGLLCWADPRRTNACAGY